MKNFFKGLSFSQLFAGALAAVTSFLFSAKIGIAGSVIGVAVASIVSSSASQIYKNVIDASSEKLQKTAQGEVSDDNSEEDEDGKSSKQATDAESSNADEKSSEDNDIESTQHIDAVSEEDKDTDSAAHRASSAKDGTANSSSDKVKSAALSKHNKRVAIVIAVVSSLIAVGVTAGIILALTDGQGTDSVVRDIVHPTVTSTSTDDHSQDKQSEVITPAPQELPSRQSTSGSQSTDSQQTQNNSGSVSTPSPQPSTSDTATSTSGTNSSNTTTNDGGTDGTDSSTSGTDTQPDTQGNQDSSQTDQSSSNGNAQAKDNSGTSQDTQ